MRILRPEPNVTQFNAFALFFGGRSAANALSLIWVITLESLTKLVVTSGLLLHDDQHFVLAIKGISLEREEFDFVLEMAAYFREHVA